MNENFTTAMNGKFTGVKNIMCSLWMKLEKEVADVNGNKMCTDRTLWNILCEMSAPH